MRINRFILEIAIISVLRIYLFKIEVKRGIATALLSDVSHSQG